MNISAYLQTFLKYYLQKYPLLAKNAAFIIKNSNGTEDVWGVDVLRPLSIYYAGILTAEQRTALNTLLADIFEGLEKEYGIPKENTQLITRASFIELSKILAHIYGYYRGNTDRPTDPLINATKEKFTAVLNLIGIPQAQQNVFFNTTFNQFIMVFLTDIIPALYDITGCAPTVIQHRIDVSAVNSQLQFELALEYTARKADSPATADTGVTTTVTFLTQGEDNTGVSVNKCFTELPTIAGIEQYPEVLQKAKLTLATIRTILDGFDTEEINSIEDFAQLVLNKILPVAEDADAEKQQSIIKILHQYMADVYKCDNLSEDVLSIKSALELQPIQPVALTEAQQKILVYIANLKQVSQAKIKFNEQFKNNDIQATAAIEMERGNFQVVLSNDIIQKLDKSTYAFLTERQVELWQVDSETKTVTINYKTLTGLVKVGEIDKQQVQMFLDSVAKAAKISSETIAETFKKSFTQEFNQLFTPLVNEPGYIVSMPVYTQWDKPINVEITSKGIYVVYPSLNYSAPPKPPAHEEEEATAIDEKPSVVLNIAMTGSGKPNEFHAIKIHKKLTADIDVKNFLNMGVVGAIKEYYNSLISDSRFDSKIDNCDTVQELTTLLIDTLKLGFSAKEWVKDVELYPLLNTLFKLKEILENDRQSYQVELEKITTLEEKVQNKFFGQRSKLLNLIDKHLLNGDIETAQNIANNLDKLGLIKLDSPAAILTMQVDILADKKAKGENITTLKYEYVYYKFMRAVKKYAPDNYTALVKLLYNNETDKTYTPTKILMKEVDFFMASSKKLSPLLLEAKNILQAVAEEHPDYVKHIAVAVKETADIQSSEPVDKQSSELAEKQTFNSVDELSELIALFINEGGNYEAVKKMFLCLKEKEAEVKVEAAEAEAKEAASATDRHDIKFMRLWFGLESKINHLKIYKEYKENLQSGNFNTLVEFVRLLSKLDYRFSAEVNSVVQALVGLSKDMPGVPELLISTVFEMPIDIATDNSGERFVAKHSQEKSDITALEYIGRAISSVKSIGRLRIINMTTGKVKKNYVVRKIDLNETDYLMLGHSGKLVAAKRDGVLRSISSEKNSLIDAVRIAQSDEVQQTYLIRLTDKELDEILRYRDSINRELAKLKQQRKRFDYLRASETGGIVIVNNVQSLREERPVLQQTSTVSKKGEHKIDEAALEKINSKIKEREAVIDVLCVLIDQSAKEGIPFKNTPIGSVSSEFLNQLLSRAPKTVNEASPRFLSSFTQRISFSDTSKKFLEKIRLSLWKRASYVEVKANEFLRDFRAVTALYMRECTPSSGNALKKYLHSLNVMLEIYHDNPAQYRSIVNVVDRIKFLREEVLLLHYKHIADNIKKYYQNDDGKINMASSVLELFVKMTELLDAKTITTEEYQSFLHNYSKNCRTKDGKIHPELSDISAEINFIESTEIGHLDLDEHALFATKNVKPVLDQCDKMIQHAAAPTVLIPHAVAAPAASIPQQSPS